MKQLQGSDTALSAAVGLSFWPRRPSPERRIAFGLRVDALAIYHRVCDNRSEAATPGQCKSKTLPGMDALAEVGISLTQTLQIVASAGLEAVILDVPLQAEPEVGTNPGMTGTATTAAEHLGDIPPLRAVGEVGIRLLF